MYLSIKISLLVLWISFSFFSGTNSQRVLQGYYGKEYPFVKKESNNGVTFGNLINEYQPKLRLTNTVIPVSYKLDIIPILVEGSPFGDQWTTDGEVNIVVECKEQAAVVTLHSTDIVINEAETKVLDGSEELSIVNQNYDVENSFFVITLQANLSVGQIYTIHLKFRSQISESLHGLYRSSYVDPESQQTIWIASTQLESIHAREIFPCFDEPALKAVFDVKIGRHQNYLVLFNTESIGNETMSEHPAWEWETFARTQVTSTYLLAIVVSFFKYNEASSNHLTGKSVRTYAPKHYIDVDGGLYAANKADELLAFFENYTAIKYPMSKMDSAAVPNFNFGAMENWGLNIYRETILLFFPGESTESERFRLIDYLSHELAHQWFGNLVTCNFWPQIWLNEGLSTYMEALATDVLFPEFDTWERFNNDATQYAMLDDAQSDVTHPVKIDDEVWTTQHPDYWFGTIVYEKGAALIHMMSGFLTENTLRKGLQKYLVARQFSGAIQDHLFESVHLAAVEDNTLPGGLTIKEILESWTLQPYFPLVRVSRANAERIYVSQEKFSNNRVGQTESSNEWDPNNLWHIPVSVATHKNPDFSPAPLFWIDKGTALKSMTANASEWMIFNAGATGYYRVLYDSHLTNLIRQQLEADHTVIASPTTRSQILDDYFNCAWQGYVQVETALQLTNYLGKETNFAVWSTVFTNLVKALNLIQDYTFQAFLLPKVESAFALVGGATNADPGVGMPTLRHAQLLDWSCALDGDQCKGLATSVYDLWKTNATSYPVRVDIRHVVYCAIVSKGTGEHFEFIKERFLDSGISSKHKGTLLNSLGCTQDPTIIDGILEEFLKDDFFVPKEQRVTLLERLAMNTAARSILVRYFRSNLDQIYQYFENVNAVVTAVSRMSSYMSTDADLQLIEALKTENPERIGAALDTSIQRIKNNAIWMNEIGFDMRTYFISGIE